MTNGRFTQDTCSQSDTMQETSVCKSISRKRIAQLLIVYMSLLLNTQSQESSNLNDCHTTLCGTRMIPETETEASSSHSGFRP